MNELQTHKQNLPVDPNDNPYIRFGNFVPQNRIVGMLLRFTKFGEWLAGQDNLKLPHGTKLVAHMASCVIGWQRWEDNKPVEQIMGLVGDNFEPPQRDQLSHTDESRWEVNDDGKSRDPWQKTSMLIFKGFDDDEIYTYSTASQGGLQALDKLSKQYGRAMRMRPNQFPVVEIGFSTYDHPEYGEMRKPVFKVITWVTRDVVDRVLEGYENDEQQELEAEAPPKQPQKQPQKQLKQQQTPPQQQPQQQPSGKPNRQTRF
jgi:hypothetical protein